MTLTRAASKRRRPNSSIITKKTPQTSVTKRSTTILKGKPNTHSNTATRINLSDTSEESSLEKDSLLVDCQEESLQDTKSSPKKNGISNSNANKQSRPLNSSVIHKNSTTTYADVRTQRAYETLEAVISTCSPIVSQIHSSNACDATEMDDGNESIVLDTTNEAHLAQLSLPTIIPTSSRTKISNYSRSEPRVREHLSSPSIMRESANRCLQSPSNRQLLNIKRNKSTAQKDNSRSTTNTQSISSSGKSTKHLTICSAFSNLALLETIPEYIQLRKALDQEVERCKAWRDDYMKLRAEFDSYRACSFPRPSVDGLTFLLELVENLTNTNSSIHTKTFPQLAKAIGVSEEELIECRHLNLQRAASAVFNKLFSTHHERAKLISIKKFAKAEPHLLNDIFCFPRQFDANNPHMNNENENELRSQNSSSTMETYLEDLHDNHSNSQFGRDFDRMDEE
ncbi:hypothetical protein I4U23_031548 [Adineta vaga]|nr:hypothetical protein I4U23_031548 [Adineta vaga]